MTVKKVSIVILNYKSYDDTVSYVKNLLHQKNINLDIVIIDNCSPNNSYFKLKEEFDDHYENIKIVQSEYNGGYAYGNNYGLKYIDKSSEYIIISNNDINLLDDLLISKWVDIHNTLPNAGLSAPVMCVNGKPSEYAAWKIPTFIDTLKSSCRFFEYIFGDKKKYTNLFSSSINKVDCLPGSLFMFNSSLLKFTDNFSEFFFDEGTFLYMEEVIISYRLKNAGYQNYLISTLKYEHYLSKTISSEVTNISMRGFLVESSKHFHRKYVGVSEFWLYIYTLLSKLYSFEEFMKQFFRAKK